MQIKFFYHTIKEQKTLKRFLFLNLFMFLLIGISPKMNANLSVLKQNYKISLSFKNEKTANVLDEISKQSGIKIAYSNAQISNETLVSVKLKTNNIEEALSVVLGNNYTYKQIEDYIAIAKINSKEKTNVPSINQAKGKQLKITGLITDTDGNPIIGATVSIESSTIGVLTDIDGKYEIQASSGDVLVFRYIGYNNEKRKVKDESTVNIRLLESSVSLDDVVVVGYGKQRKNSVVSSVNSISATELKLPTRNLTNNIAGQLAGVIAIQRSGEPGNDNAEFWIRGTSSFAGGTSPLVLVDGAPRAMQDIEPDEIETFTVLKDASATAVYGAEGANGVVLITSKRGKKDKPRISFRGEYGVLSPTRLPELIGSVDYLNLYNEARRNDGQPQYFSDELIAKYASKEDPDLYPDTDWLSMLNDRTSNQRYTLNVRGGSDKASYFVSGAYFNEAGIFKNNNLENYETNIGLKRYNLRSNVDINVTNSTLLSIDLSGQYSQQNNPGENTEFIFTRLSTAPPYLIPMVYSDGTIPGHPRPSGYRVNPYNLLVNSGYTKEWTTSIQSTVKLDQKLDFITKGLSVVGRISFDSYSQYNSERKKTPNQYYARGRDENGKLKFDKVVNGTDALGDPKESNSGDRKIYIEGSLNYNRTFNKKHSVGGMILYMQKEKQNHNEALAFRKQSFVGRATYSYDDRYFIEGSFGYTGSETFSEDKRYGLFPAVGAAYVLTNEAFIPESFTNIVSKIKLRASYGRTGNDATGGDRFLYRETLKTDAPGYNIGIGTDGGLNGVGSGIIENRFAATQLGWEIETKKNLGIDLGFFGGKIDIQADYFDNFRRDILLQRNTLGAAAGFQQRPWQNFGKVSNKGMDGSVIINEQVGEVKLTFRGNVTFARNKIVEYDEIPQKYEWMNRTGTRLNSWNVHIADGLYTNDDFIITTNPNGSKNYQLKPEVPNSSLSSGIRPGDIKYIDQNKDGVIDDFDKVQDVGNPSIPELVYGFGQNISFKGFYASIFFQGTGKTSTVLGTSNAPGFFPFNWGVDESSVRVQALDRWTEENPSQNVMFPRTHSEAYSNNRTPSTWWMRDASFIRLKNVEIGYNFNKKLLKKSFLQAARVYVMGYNLAVWDDVKIWDPEIGNGNAGMRYPLPRTYTMGLEMTF